MEALDKLLAQHTTQLAHINQRLSGLASESSRLAKVTQLRQVRRLRPAHSPLAEERNHHVEQVKAGISKLKELCTNAEKTLEDEAATMKRHQDQRPARQWQLDEIARLQRILNCR